MIRDYLPTTGTECVRCQKEFVDTALQQAVRCVRHLWEVYGTPMVDANQCVPIVNASDRLNELFFCLLGGYSITYEANVAAYGYLRQEGCLQQQWFAQPIDHEGYLARHLMAIPKNLAQEDSPIFGYRFPNAKARVIARAALWLDTTFNWDITSLFHLTPHESREILLTCPGIGYKTASWFLRNTGHGAGLAIVDVHVERLAKHWAIIPHGFTASHHYLEIEQRLLHVCELIPAPLDVVDLVLWHYARGDFQTYGSPQSTKI